MQSEKSVVPADVYYNILHRIKDLTFLWTTCRAVSRDFRDAVDLVFIRRHLPKTYLAADMGTWYSEEHGKVFLLASFAFDSLDPTDPSIALFKDKDCHADFQPKLIRRLKNQFDAEFGNVCHAPRIVVQVRRLANDTPIRDMKPDWDNLSLTANWKKMFSEFFAEEKAYARVMRAQLDAATPAIVAMREDPIQDFGAMMTYLFETYDKHDTTARRQVRERRIKRHVWEQSHIDWEFTDSEGLRNVTDARRAVGYREFSDDGEETEEEQHEEEEEDAGDEETDDEEGEENEEEEDNGEEASEGDEDRDDLEGSGRRTKRRTEVRTRPQRSKTSTSLPLDQSTGPSPAPTGFEFTFKAPTPSGGILD